MNGVAISSSLSDGIFEYLITDDILTPYLTSVIAIIDWIAVEHQIISNVDSSIRPLSEKDRYFSKEEYDNFKLKISNIWSNEHSKINIESNFFLRACYRLKRWDELSLVNDLIEPLSKTSEGYIQLASICMTHVVTSDGESYNQFNMDGFQFLLQNEDLQISEVRDYVEENKDSSPERASEVLCAIGLSEEF